MYDLMNDDMTLDSQPIANPAYALREDEQGWTALVNLDNAAGVALNETALLVWKAVDGTRTAAQNHRGSEKMLFRRTAVPPRRRSGDSGDALGHGTYRT